jgi:hypothetical protein
VPEGKMRAYGYAGRFHATGACTRHGMTLNEVGSVKYKGGILFIAHRGHRDHRDYYLMIAVVYFKLHFKLPTSCFLIHIVIPHRLLPMGNYYMNY